MKAKELFKTKAEVAEALDELGVEYSKIKTGVNKGKPTQTFKDLCEIYDASKLEEVEEEFVPVLTTFNPMTFRFS
jgi:hypothetical protein